MISMLPYIILHHTIWYDNILYYIILYIYILNIIIIHSHLPYRSTWYTPRRRNRIWRWQSGCPRAGVAAVAPRLTLEKLWLVSCWWRLIKTETDSPGLDICLENTAAKSQLHFYGFKQLNHMDLSSLQEKWRRQWLFFATCSRMCTRWSKLLLSQKWWFWQINKNKNLDWPHN